jgi:hypothetical protein
MDANIPTMAELDPDSQLIALAYYQSGVQKGIQLGRAQVEQEDADRWAGVG